jgi:type II secretory pathway pseudopilin PulG
VEVIVVVTVVGILAAIALPPLARMRTAATLRSGRAQVTAAVSLAQATGIRWGRTTTLTIDTVGDVLSISVDTTRTTPTPPVVVRRYLLGQDIGVQIGSDVSAICFNNRGVGTIGMGCSSPGAQLVLRAPGTSRTDTVRINSAGRVWR